MGLDGANCEGAALRGALPRPLQVDPPPGASTRWKPDALAARRWSNRAAVSAGDCESRSGIVHAAQCGRKAAGIVAGL
jgi:hypothetical protein